MSFYSKYVSWVVNKLSIKLTKLNFYTTFHLGCSHMHQCRKASAAVELQCCCDLCKDAVGQDQKRANAAQYEHTAASCGPQAWYVLFISDLSST